MELKENRWFLIAILSDIAIFIILPAAIVTAMIGMLTALLPVISVAFTTNIYLLSSSSPVIL